MTRGETTYNELLIERQRQRAEPDPGDTKECITPPWHPTSGLYGAFQEAAFASSALSQSQVPNQGQSELPVNSVKLPQIQVTESLAEVYASVAFGAASRFPFGLAGARSSCRASPAQRGEPA